MVFGGNDYLIKYVKHPKFVIIAKRIIFKLFIPITLFMF